ncbi:MAG: flagellar hook protein FlgE [Betaproteobacteria bacterium]|nr:flagellar hook protein FlgE [Betaproteobacteria bacterium]
MGFQQGLSGLNGASRNLDVISNNIANSSTAGFKTSKVQFADVYASSVYGTASLQVGIGTQVTENAQQFTQGNITVTNNPLDMGISGEGFFKMTPAGSDAVSYTRNGQFHLDGDGNIVNGSGLILQGWLADSTGTVIPGATKSMKISFDPAPPKATTTANLTANLDAGASTIAAAINPNSPSTYNWSTSMTIYDQLGEAHGLVYYFKKTASNTWAFDMYVNNNLVIGPPGGGATPTHTMTFNSNGTVNQIDGAAAAAFSPTVTTAMLGSGAGNLTFSLDLTKFSQYGAAFGSSQVTQDGYASGRIAGLSVSKDGLVEGRYTNGQSRNLGQVVLTSFNNPRGLLPLGNNQWARTEGAGDAVENTPGSGVLGVLQSGAVEESNVDLTAELVNMIVAQRLYQANAQSVRAQDQLLQTLVNLR